jgi:carboxymethylenebutenolidase
LVIPKSRARALIAIAESDDEKQMNAKIALRRAYDAAKLPAEIDVYAKTRHGWCVPDTRAYDQIQAERAWSRLLALFGEARL